jgi:hypothetical protein
MPRGESPRTNQSRRYDGNNSPPSRGFMDRNEERIELSLELAGESIRVRLDANGIHFRHANGSLTEGHLSWSHAIALSLLPPDLPRVGAIEAA